MKRNNEKTRLMTLTGMLMALTTVATMVIQIPTPTKGYVNLGDTVVNLSAWILGGTYGAVAGGIGSALADIMSGYAIYAPATLIIKALMAFVCFKVYTICSGKFNSLASRIISVIVSEVIMIVGYALFAGVFYGSVQTAVLGIPENAVQGIIGASVSVVLYECVIKRAVGLRNK
ncbi:MAG: ECF transporter S component [Ruminococcus sp.]|nr:ECF transporter S component [Ruminococcus sp.]